MDIKKGLLWIIIFVSLSSFALAAPLNGKLFLNFNDNIVDQWSAYTVNTGDSPTYSADFPVWNVTGDGGTKSISYDGANDWHSVDWSGSNTYNSDSNFTVSFWYKDSNAVADDTIMGITRTAGVYNLGFIRIMEGTNSFVASKGKITILIETSTDGHDVGISYSANVSNGQWNMITFKFQGNGTASGIAYINGTKISPNLVLGAWADLGNGEAITSGGTNGDLGIARFDASNAAYAENQIDNLKWYNWILNDTQVANLYNCGNETTCAPPAVPATLSIDYNYPANNTYNSTYLHAGFNLTYSNTTAASCFLKVNNTIYYNYTGIIPNATNRIINWTGMTNGLWNWSIYCNNTEGKNVNGTFRDYIMDNIKPTITWRFPSAANTTLLTPVFGNLTTNFTIFDTNLYSFQYNITYQNGTKYFSNTSILSATSEYNVTRLTAALYEQNMTNMSGRFSATIKACDGHTALEIGDFDISAKTNDALEFKFDKKTFTITPEFSAEDSGYDRKKDRYSFYYNTPLTITNPSFIVSSTERIEIVKNSEYPGHLVIPTLDKWIDFDDGKSIVVTQRIDDNHIRVTLLGKAKTWYFNSVGSLNCRTEKVNFFIVGESQKYSTLALRGQIKTFTLNVTYNSSYVNNIVANFTFNNTIFTGATKTHTPAWDYWSIGVGMPNTTESSITNKTFYWNYTITKADYTNTTYGSAYNNISIYQGLVDNCTSYSMRAINFTTYYEANNSLQKSKAEYYVYYTTGEPGASYFNYSGYHTGGLTYNHQICIYPNWSTMYANIQARFKGGTGVNDWHTIFLQNITLDNTSVKYNIYLTNATSAYTFYVKDQNYDPVQGALIKILKYDIADNAFKLTEILETDDDGKGIGHVTLNDVWYKFIIEYAGQTKLSSASTLLTGTERTFVIIFAEDYFDNYDQSREIVSSLVYSNNTRTFLFSWNDPQNVMSHGCLKIIKRGLEETLYSHQCTATTAGSLSRALPTNVTDATFTAIAYVMIDGQNYNRHTQTISFNYIYQDFGETGVFAGVFILMALGLAFIWNPAMAVIAVGFGMILNNAVGFWHFSWVAIIGAVILLGSVAYLIGRWKE